MDEVRTWGEDDRVSAPEVLGILLTAVLGDGIRSSRLTPDRRSGPGDGGGEGSLGSLEGITSAGSDLLRPLLMVAGRRIKVGAWSPLIEVELVRRLGGAEIGTSTLAMLALRRNPSFFPSGFQTLSGKLMGPSIETPASLLVCTDALRLTFATLPGMV